MCFNEVDSLLLIISLLNDRLVDYRLINDLYFLLVFLRYDCETKNKKT